MRTWWCKTCTAFFGKNTFHLLKGRPGCDECRHYEVRCESA